MSSRGGPGGGRGRGGKFKKFTRGGMTLRSLPFQHSVADNSKAESISPRTLDPSIVMEMR